DNPDTNRFCQSCGSQIVTPVSPAMTAGVLLGDRYRIVKEIGQGGFGRTYLCEDVNRFNEPCVLKEFAPQVQGTALLTKAQQLFEREAGVMYRLQHPQIPKFREMFRVNRSNVGQLFLVQDYVAGDNYQQLLRHKLKQGKTFTELEVTEFLTQILPVLGYIHSLGVIHRDISPDNLIGRQSDGLPVLIDFGGVKQVAVNAASQYMSGNNLVPSDIPTRLGKVGYAPNEQMQRGVVFPHSDLYALAATTLVLLTGKEPPDLIDPQKFSWKWREHTSLSPNLARILDRMLQLRPHDRFASAQDILTALTEGDLGNNLIVPSLPKSIPATPQQPQTIAPTPQQPPTVVTPKPQPVLPTVTTAKKSSLMHIIGETWLAIAAIVGAIALGWVVAMLMSKRGEPVRSATNSDLVAASPNPSNNARSIVTNDGDGQPAATIGSRSNSQGELTLPPVLASTGVDPTAYGAVVKQVFISQNPQVKVVDLHDRQLRSQVETISTNLGAKLTSQLSPETIQKIGQYEATDRADWQSQVKQLHLSERALVDLTDAKYQAITAYSAQKLRVDKEQFLDTPIGQIYLATMLDRVRAIQARQALSEIVFPVGGTSGTVSGTLKPGEGKAYIASLVGGQEIAANIHADAPI
ncbi:serine/threonine-protein kinase, partial [Chamaesiphon sp. VAR_69_metabat_338]|uniref:serine/threonine-protein kinase n=1 Tax=Chamaesiphon sp. VAR_69_metabat_338 TaxID=2964704 RepID=UPI00286DDE0E